MPEDIAAQIEDLQAQIAVLRARTAVFEEVVRLGLLIDEARTDQVRLLLGVLPEVIPND